MSGPWQTALQPEVLSELPPHQKLVAVALAAIMLVAVIELVRKRRLREEYSWLWIGTAILLMTLALQPRLLYLFQVTIGATQPVPALISGALVFLMLVSLMMSVRLSRLTFRNARLNRELSLQQRRIEELAAEIDRLGGAGTPVVKSKAKDGAA